MIRCIFALLVTFSSHSNEFQYNNFNNNKLTINLAEKSLFTKFGDTKEAFLDCKNSEYRYCIVTPTLAFVIPINIESSWVYGNYSFSVIQEHKSYSYMGKNLGQSMWIRAETHVNSNSINKVHYDLLFSTRYGLVYFTRSANSNVIDIWVLASEMGIGAKPSS